MSLAAAAFGIIPAPASARTPETPIQSTSAATPRPNIVVILVDDLGHNDISLNGNPLVHTPNIDAIARDGARFVTAYAGDAVCAPSRAALLTGRDPQRFGFEYLPNEAGFAERVKAFTPGAQTPQTNQVFNKAAAPKAEVNGLALTEITLAQFLKSGGYHTGMIGKWHLGRAPVLNPVNRGFDEFLGILGGAALHADPSDPNYVAAKLPWNGNDANLWKYVTHKIQRGLGEPYEAPGYLSDVYADEAARYIHANKAHPFFLYLAFDEPHMPLQAPRKIYDRLSYIKDEKTRVYYAMIEALDSSVGKVMASLKSEGVDRNTIVIFTSDNGGSPFPRIPQMNLPYRGWKLTYFEGGTNVPMMMRWPGHIPSGTVVPGIISQLDIFATAAGAAHMQLPTDRKYDGVDLLPTLTNKGTSTDLFSRTLVWRKDTYRSIRLGRYKLQLSADPAETWLYDMERDPTERIDLAAAMPQKVAELKAALVARESEFKAPAWSPQGRLRVDIDGVPEDTAVPRDYIYWTN